MGFDEPPTPLEAFNTTERERMTYDAHIRLLRQHEYPMLGGITYLDRGGTTLASKTLLKAFCEEIITILLANPHFDASEPSPSSSIVTETRLEVLKFFDADPDHFDVVFTANATPAIKLVMECFSDLSGGFDHVYHRNCHTSLVGVRELSSRTHCLATDDQTEEWLEGRSQPLQTTSSNRTTLFAYSAQSNMNGQRLPLEWPQKLRVSAHHPKIFTLLDVAAFASTTPLDLSNHASAPDFAVLSFYKIFGFPDLGALIVRRSASPILEHRKYFGGGTTEMTTLEDGTLAIRSILALRCAIDSHRQLFGGMHEISKHTAWLGALLYVRLSALTHTNGTTVCHIYKAPTSVYGDPKTQGATFVFNMRHSNGVWIIPYAIGSILRSNNIHVRTGGLCNPAGMAPALGLSSAGMRAAFDKGFRCNQRSDLYENGEPIGMVRVTIGAMSTLGDIERLVECIKQQLMEPGHGTRNTPKVDMKPRADVSGRRRKSRLGCQVPFICPRYCTGNYQRQCSARD
ncbi:hypothetical protein HBI80_255500 [Parastagonospora nodorum]|nr:hypothetical protein HBI80_255500 [Parastagonospora nodorum]KAH5720591.1 hypothetical protein HBI17_255480 [Parastagonospora nodorum]